MMHWVLFFPGICLNPSSIASIYPSFSLFVLAISVETVFIASDIATPVSASCSSKRALFFFFRCAKSSNGGTICFDFDFICEIGVVEVDENVLELSLGNGLIIDSGRNSMTSSENFLHSNNVLRLS